MDDRGFATVMTGATARQSEGTSPLPDYTVDCVTRDGDFDRLQPEWNRLVEAAGIRHPFARHEWLSTWWRCFRADNRLEIVTVRCRDRLLAVAPLMSNEARVYGIKADRLQSIYNVHTPRLEFIVAQGHEDAYEAIWRHLAARGDWDILELDQLPEGSATLDAIAALAHDDGFCCDRWASGQAPYLPLGDWDRYFEHLPAKHRSNLRNRMKRLHKIGTVKLETVTQPGPQLDAALRDGMRIEAAGWKGDEGSAIDCEDDVRRFYELFAQRAAERGQLRLQFLAVDGERIAFAYSLCFANRFFLVKTGYDPKFSKYSPFNALLCEILRGCHEQGLVEFDFLGVFDSWKKRWTQHGREHCWLYVFSPSPTARLIRSAKFGVAPRVKQLLGRPAADANAAANRGG